MKQIIVPTDFSVPAENAMLYAGQLAQKTGAGVLVVHVFQIPVSMSEVPVLMISAEELKNNADAGLLKAKEILARHYPGIEIKTESRMGDITEELNDICKTNQPLAIVTGKHGAGGVERGNSVEVDGQRLGQARRHARDVHLGEVVPDAPRIRMVVNDRAKGVVACRHVRLLVGFRVPDRSVSRAS